MITAVSGSRRVTDEKKIISVLEDMKISRILHGGCRGVDLLVRDWAIRRDYPIVEYKAEWDRYGKKAGPIRNEKMINDCQILVAFPDAESVGTRHAINYARKIGKSVVVIEM